MKQRTNRRSMKRNLNLGKIPNMKNLLILRRIVIRNNSIPRNHLLKKKSRKYIPLANFVDLVIIVDQDRKADIPNRQQQPIQIQIKIQEIMNPKNLEKVMQANEKNVNNKRRNLQKIVMMAFQIYLLNKSVIFFFQLTVDHFEFGNYRCVSRWDSALSHKP